MEAYALDWLNLLVRWLHLTAGVAWIGTSFYYIALDYHLLAPKNKDEDLAGEVWEIHGGGFYRVEKYKVAPRTLPSPLHWFKWEAYTTWLSGFSLLVVLYYANAATYLVDRAVLDLVQVVVLKPIGPWIAGVSQPAHDGIHVGEHQVATEPPSHPEL